MTNWKTLAAIAAMMVGAIAISLVTRNFSPWLVINAAPFLLLLGLWIVLLLRQRGV